MLKNNLQRRGVPFSSCEKRPSVHRKEQVSFGGVLLQKLYCSCKAFRKKSQKVSGRRGRARPRAEGRQRNKPAKGSQAQREQAKTKKAQGEIGGDYAGGSPSQ